MVYDFLTTATGKQGCWENSKDTRKLSPGPAWCTICKAIRLRRATCSIFLTSIARCPRLTAESSGALAGAGPSSCIRCWTATKWSYDFWYCSLTCAPKTQLQSEPAGPITTDALVKQSLVCPLTLFKPMGNTKKDWKEDGKWKSTEKWLWQVASLNWK